MQTGLTDESIIERIEPRKSLNIQDDEHQRETFKVCDVPLETQDQLLELLRAP